MRRALIAVAMVGVMGWAYETMAEEIVPVKSEWNWLHPTDGVDPAKEIEDFHTTFASIEFDDSDWKTGKDSAGPGGGFGYGQPGSEDFDGVDIGTPDRLNDEGETNRKTAYFRLYFSAEKAYKGLVIRLQRDDGLIIYIDGKEVGRDNVGDEKEAYDLHAEETVAGDGETEVNEFKLKGKLGAGDHILAISLHNRARGSSDLRIAEISLHGTVDDGGDDADDDTLLDGDQ